MRISDQTTAILQQKQIRISGHSCVAAKRLLFLSAWRGSVSCSATAATTLGPSEALAARLPRAAWHHDEKHESWASHSPTVCGVGTQIRTDFHHVETSRPSATTPHIGTRRVCKLVKVARRQGYRQAHRKESTKGGRPFLSMFRQRSGAAVFPCPDSRRPPLFLCGSRWLWLWVFGVLGQVFRVLL